MSELRKISLIACVVAALAACGQTGKLYLPGTAGEVTTRSTQTPVEPGADSPQPVDQAPGNDAAGKNDKGKKTPAPEPQKN